MSMKNKVKSKLVNFSISSASHPSPMRITNAWVVPDLRMNVNKIDLTELKKQYPYLLDVPFQSIETATVSVLIGADHPHIHLYTETRSRCENEPVALSTKLGWVLMGGNNYSSGVVRSNKITIKLDDMVQQFWKLESYGTSSKDNLNEIPSEEKKALKMLESTTSKENCQYKVGLLWKDDNPKLPNNRSLALSRLYSLENKLKKNPDLKSKYIESINDYISKGHAVKLTKEQSEKTTEITNYVPHHAVFNV